MNIEELKKQFIVDEDVLRARLEPLVTKALNHCKLDKQGQVIILNHDLRARDQIMLVLSARAIGAQLDPAMSANVTAAELAKYTHLPADQVRARSTDLVKSRLAESPERGVFRAIAHKVEAFLDAISLPRGKRGPS